MSKTKKLTDPTVPTLTAIADTALVTVLDPDSGAISTIEFGDLKTLIKDSIKVGSRNMLTGSASFSGWTNKTGGYKASEKEGICSVYIGPKAFAGAFKAFPFVMGSDYTFSIYCDNPNMAILYIKYVNDGIVGISQSASFINESRMCRQVSEGCFQMSVTAKCIASGIAALEFETLNIPDSMSLRFWAPKLEIGNIATDWSLAPEDLMGGGINATLASCYKFGQKGGQQHEQSNKSAGIRHRDILYRGNNDQKQWFYQRGAISSRPRRTFSNIREGRVFELQHTLSKGFMATMELQNHRLGYSICDVRRFGRHQGNHLGYWGDYFLVCNCKEYYFKWKRKRRTISIPLPRRSPSLDKHTAIAGKEVVAA